MQYTQSQVDDFKAQGVFIGVSEKLLMEEAIKNAIDQDPKVDPGTDIFDYTVIETAVDFGGFAQTYRSFVKLKRVRGRLGG